MGQNTLTTWLAAKGITHTAHDGYVEMASRTGDPIRVTLLDLDGPGAKSPEPPDGDVRHLLVFSEEWQHRRAACEALLAAKLGVFERRLVGRACKVNEVAMDLARGFLKEHHIQGANHLSLVAFGLFDGDELVGVMTLGRHSRNTADNRIVLDRLCFKGGVQVVGGAGKLFSRCLEWAKERKYDEIISFSDNRWSAGGIYEALGFEMEKAHRPDYVYYDPATGERHSKQSQKKSSSDCPDSMTEREWTSYRGLIRFYDWGKKRWAYNLRPGERPTWKDELSRRCAEQHSQGVFKHSHIRGYFESEKNQAAVYFGSSYELRCLFLLEDDPTIKAFRRCEVFKGENSWRNPDLWVEPTAGGIEIWEVKPKGMLDHPAVQDQVRESREFAARNHFGFRLWTEDDSGLDGERAIIKWAKHFIKDHLGDDGFLQRQAEGHRRNAKKHYDNVIAQDKVEVFCTYCNEYHHPLRLTYEKNIERNNGQYICERYGGHLAGSKPKPTLRKVNPLAAEGRKICNRCKEPKLLEEFGVDKTKADGRATRCMKCRAEVATAKYQAKKATLDEPD